VQDLEVAAQHVVDLAEEIIYAPMKRLKLATPTNTHSFAAWP
jgi:hypothetical protein